MTAVLVVERPFRIPRCPLTLSEARTVLSPVNGELDSLPILPRLYAVTSTYPRQFCGLWYR